jgi:hypothetical protein
MLHCNYNSDQLALAFMLVGTPPKEILEKFACYEHLKVGLGLGCGVLGIGYRFRVWGSGYRFRVWGVGFWV